MKQQPDYTLNNDTICAPATASAVAALSIIRLSGRDAIKICNKVFHPGKLDEKDSHTVHYGAIKDGDETIDDVLVSLFRNPDSYTGEDIAEISCHGSPYIQQRILALLIKEGARLANAGEFTMRAFLNGKYDLLQAEAVADLIASGSEAAHKVAMRQMRGGFSKEIKALREELVKFASLIELELDFSEEDVEFADRKEMVALVQHIMEVIAKLIDSFKMGNVLKNGIPVVIAGKPNAGKSTLLNALLNEERAIVSEIAGTTRDSIEDSIQIEGISFRFTDTAGIQDSSNRIDAMGVKRALEKIKDASVVIYLFDATASTAEQLTEGIRELEKELEESGAEVLLVGNKCDLADMTGLKKHFSGFENVIYISAKEGQGMEELKSALLGKVQADTVDTGDTILTNARHLEALSKAREALEQTEKGIAKKLSGELLAQDIRQALHHLGLITGEVHTDELLATIFSHFCIGK